MSPRTEAALTGHAIRSFLRNPVAAFFTLAFPVTFLIIVASLVGDVRTGSGVPVAQFLVAPFAVFGVAQASFVLVAVDMAGLRENGVLLRLRATPVPAWAVLAARIGASVVASGMAVALLVTVGILGYDVRIVWHKLPAMLVTLLLGIACCAALGLALAALTRTVLVAQSLAQGLLITLAFVSDVFIVGAVLPRWLDVLGSVLPLKHFARAMAETFDPAPGSGFSPGHLTVLALWTVAGAVVASLRFGWQPRGAGTPRVPVDPDSPAAARLSPPTVSHRSPLAGQIAYALLGLRRNGLAVFFSLVFPALLLALFPTVFGGGQVHGMPMAQYLFAGMIAYSATVTAYVDMPESVVVARAAGVLKRLRGTPLPFRWYLAGRAGAALFAALLAAALLTAVGVGFLDVRLDATRLPALLLTIAAGVLCFAALGLAVAALLASARSIVAVTLGTLLPLCFVSEVFVVGDQPLPGRLTAVANVFPLRHLLQAVLAATDPAATGTGLAPGHLAVLAGWTALGLLIATRRRAALD
ncbi:ABC transporter permease [Actinoplanes oblitus]|uniref:Transport permease protein n=1 Tax=Actinoplanes oblitus TaxID=3040509 RepID=A0ABY8W525_9ACTN|nr:ABC transporter permease [Actinoplanes oblitus]WIM92920.1 ABC transporter permease [Actinoplanes oblitus]